MSNALMHLSLYKEGTTWKFDDVHNAIKAEPFVAGMSEIISHFTGKRKKCEVIFGAEPFPGCRTLNLEREEAGGGWYTETETEMYGWLCPVTRVYYNGIPQNIYFQIKEKNHEKN